MIPIKLYAATEQKDITFRQVHREDGGRIRFRRVCSVCGEEVPYEDVAKGFELPTGEIVILTEDDMAGLPLPTTRSIEVIHFTPAEQLDPILFNRSYYVEPESAGTRAYVLLRDALERSGKVAVAQVALRQRESLATLRVRDGVLVLETLLWPDEVRVAAFPFLDDDIEVRSQELKMAGSLIDSMTFDFDPAAHHDGYREALQELVDAKTEGRDVVQPDSTEGAAGEPASLADALKASLAVVRGGPREGGSTGAAPARAGTSGSGTARSGTSRSGTSRSGTAKSGTAKSGTAKPAGPRAGATRTKAASAGRANAAGEKSAPRTAAAATKPATKKATADAEPAAQRRPRRRAS
jgi:DNA end-binding protein Ku